MFSTNKTRMRHYLRHNSDHSDIESLQTDVMRFMAILGLCLTGIFSLLQSISLDSEPDNPIEKKTIDSKDMLNNEFAVLKDNNPITAIRSIEQEIPKKEMSFLVQKETAETEITNKLISAIEKNKIQQTMMANIQKTEEPLIKKIQEPIEQIVKQSLNNKNVKSLSKEDVSNASIKEQEQSTHITSNDKEGFELRFVSETTLWHLIKNNKTIRLWIINNNEYKQLILLNGRISFLSEKPPNQYYEMLPETVPKEFVQAADNQLKKTVEDFIWGIEIPENVQQKIMTLISKHTSGVITIDQNLNVQLNGQTS